MLNAPQLRATIDLGEPVALLAIAVLHRIDDDEEARSVIGRLGLVKDGTDVAMYCGVARKP